MLAESTICWIALFNTCSSKYLLHSSDLSRTGKKVTGKGKTNNVVFVAVVFSKQPCWALLIVL